MAAISPVFGGLFCLSCGYQSSLTPLDLGLPAYLAIPGTLSWLHNSVSGSMSRTGLFTGHYRSCDHGDVLLLSWLVFVCVF